MKPNYPVHVEITIPSHISSHSDWQNLARNAHFKPAAVARLCGVSPRTVQRYFKKHYHCTLGEWMRNYRLEMAYQRLLTGESIKCVAIDLGYKQLSHFSRDFKTRYGCAPKFLERTNAKLGGPAPAPAWANSTN
jgi:AraC-like DNA-binding protein